MLKFSIYTGAWVLTILLLVARVIETEQYNIIHSVNAPMCWNCRNYRYPQCCETLKELDHSILNYSSAFLNGTCLYDSSQISDRVTTGNPTFPTNNFSKGLQRLLKNKIKGSPTTNSRFKLVPNPRTSVYNNYGNDTRAFNNILPKFIKETKNNRKNHVDYKWRQRTLCAVVDGEKYSSEASSGNVFSYGDTGELRNRKTPLGYNALAFMNDIDDAESSKAHVRVKRNEFEGDSYKYQHDHLKNLANSFPQNSYDTIGESSYDDDDASLHMKREVKSQEFFLNDDEPKDTSDEDGQSKILSVNSPTVSASANKEKSAGSNLISWSSVNGNTCTKNNLKSEDQTGSQHLISSQDSSSAVLPLNQGSNENLEGQDLPDDSMLAVELIRKKRDEDAKVHKQKVLVNKVSSDSRDAVKLNENFSNGEKRSVLESGVPGWRYIPSSSVVANLKAEMLRIRRKAKENRRVKSSKSKKKKKHTAKKHNEPRNSRRLINDVRLKSTKRSGVARNRKSHAAGKADPKKAKKPNDRTDLDREHSTKNVTPRWKEKVKKGVGKMISLDKNSKFPSTARGQLTTGNDRFNVGPYERVNSFVARGEKQPPSLRDEPSMESLDTTILRSKRAKEMNHGFQSKEDELRYYQNIREPGSELERYINGGQGSLTRDDQMVGNRAVRSVEEVRELAKKLVRKVNELQNYLNVDGSKNDKGEKRIGARAIDDLCSNVSTACDAFKETPTIIQNCASSTDHADSAAKVPQSEVDPATILEGQNFVQDNAKSSIEKKRSIGSRVAITSSNSRRNRRRDEPKSDRKWGKWTDWSSCSVTCGKGRQIRWRYCLHDCSTAETEMEEKSCQLPACPPGKFLGIF